MLRLILRLNSNKLSPTDEKILSVGDIFVLLINIYTLNYSKLESDI